MSNPLKNIKIGYKAVLFVLTIIFIFIYSIMFTLHIGTSIINSIKYRFFTFKTIYIVTDLPADNKILKFCVSNIETQAMQRYKYRVLSFAECQETRKCKNNVGIIISQEPKLAYNFRKAGLLEIPDLVVDFIKNSGGIIDKDIIILRKKDIFYYYAVGIKAPFNGMLINMPISMVSAL